MSSSIQIVPWLLPIALLAGGAWLLRSDRANLSRRLGGYAVVLLSVLAAFRANAAPAVPALELHLSAVRLAAAARPELPRDYSDLLVVVRELEQANQILRPVGSLARADAGFDARQPVRLAGSDRLAVNDLSSSPDSP